MARGASNEAPAAKRADENDVVVMKVPSKASTTAVIFHVTCWERNSDEVRTCTVLHLRSNEGTSWSPFTAVNQSFKMNECAEREIHEERATLRQETQPCGSPRADRHYG